MPKKYSIYSFTIKGKRHTFRGLFNKSTGMYEAIFRGTTGWGSTIEEAINDAINEHNSI